jgi:hypothetical protein
VRRVLHEMRLTIGQLRHAAQSVFPRLNTPKLNGSVRTRASGSALAGKRRIA